ncbi:MAG: hypothetical protein IKE60_27610 [Reyranella sp.]|jgi:hypothetical protein|uniref:hypothetical protein n=1 Tax=Reyranella sp. TaxID=1929291 RepID=UPI0025E93525|nr:hypothetical protein [Reyranella sp.]MBR2818463.1 hypothetical protein [Reyranella sp.]
MLLLDLNVKALYLIGGIVMTCGAGAALLTWYHHRDAPGLRAWAAALLLSILGVLILRSPAAVPTSWIIPVANAMIVSGFAVIWLSLRQFNRGHADAARLVVRTAGVVAAYLALYGIASLAGAGPLATAIPFSLFLGLLSIAAAHETWQGRAHDGLRSRLPTALAFVGLGVARVLRACMLILQVADVLPPETVASLHPVVLYATIVLVLAITYGLVLMANEGAVRRDAELFADRQSSLPTN